MEPGLLQCRLLAHLNTPRFGFFPHWEKRLNDNRSQLSSGNRTCSENVWSVWNRTIERTKTDPGKYSRTIPFCHENGLQRSYEVPLKGMLASVTFSLLLCVTVATYFHQQTSRTYWRAYWPSLDTTWHRGHLNLSDMRSSIDLDFLWPTCTHFGTRKKHESNYHSYFLHSKFIHETTCGNLRSLS